ncbi:hypothetical protein [Corynebacterium alimapuense]|uniref:Uncharacterized protein n=1 Tax=Corynebacterium alimapuense TaxID=1576874 RepID=A0A3M8K7G2_9CORY|nr:hypothetical protein [Corynebacterium alimapuense]RNE48418.1 hypothetical protein C5L39_07870 [Corynebacterium alimapuense]
MDMVKSLVAAAREIGEIAEPAHRAAVERWILEYTAENVGLGTNQAMVAAGQLAQRYGYEVIADELTWDQLCRRPLYPEVEWSISACWLADGARPIVVPSSHGQPVELFLAEDITGAALDDLIDPIEHREVRSPEISVPEFSEFADHVGVQERKMFGQILESGGLVRWDLGLAEGISCELNFDAEDVLGTGLYDCEILFLLNVNLDTGNEDVMQLVLGMVAQLTVLYLTGVLDAENESGEAEEERYEEEGEATPEAQISPLELDLIVWLAARRLRVEVSPGPAATDWLMSPEIPAPEDLRWALVYDAANGVEALLLGSHYQVND